jgi:hypothetical protein
MNEVLKREVTEGDKAEEARKKINKSKSHALVKQRVPPNETKVAALPTE